MKNLNSYNKGFSIIEILVGIFIFSLGLISIFLLISGSSRLSIFSKNQIIASNLSREGIELVRNIRDSNYNSLHKWNLINPGDLTKFFEAGKVYTIENNYQDGAVFPIEMKEIINFGEGKSEINGKMSNYRLCLDTKKRYTYDCSGGNKRTNFYRYIKIEKVKYNDGTEKEIDNAFRVISNVIWTTKGYHESKISTIITDWKRL